MTHTAADLIKKYVETRAFIERKAQEFDATMKPYRDGLGAIENMFLALLNEQGADNIKTEFGTAYKVEHMNTKVVDKDAVVYHAIEYWNKFGRDMLTVSVSKTVVRDQMNQNGGVPPPGLEIGFFAKVNVRAG